MKVLVEGEEEVGGESIAKYVSEKKDKLKADFALVSDTDMFAPELPTLSVGLRGLIYTEIEVRGAKVDLHSGIYGGAAPNPFFALCQIIAKLKDENGHILIPGFYDQVGKPSADELKAWKSLPFDEERYRSQEVGSKELTGEHGFSVQERTWARPTLEVHGMPGGFIRRGREDGHSCEGDCKNINANRAQHGPKAQLRSLQDLCSIARAEGCRGRGETPQHGRSYDHSHRQSFREGLDRGNEGSVRERDGIRALRWIDSGRRRFRQAPEDPFA